MRRCRPAALLLGLATAAALPGAAAQELLTNGGFEAGNLKNWLESCVSPKCAPVSDAGSPTHYGSRALSLGGTRADWTSLSVRQSVLSLGGATRLELGGWVRAADGGEPMAAVRVALRVGFVGAGAQALAGGCAVERAALPPPEWERWAVGCDVPAGATGAWVAVEFASVRADARVLVDDVFLHASATAPAAVARAPGAAVAAAGGEAVPRALHLIFGLSADFGGKPFGMVHHLVIKAAKKFLSPQAIYFYHAHEPTGEWWAKSKPLLELRRVTPPATIFGKTLKRFAHQADVIRLELLQEFGGVYMDLDILLLAPLDAHFAHPMTLAHEGVDGSIGLGNALMFAARNASFVHKWYGRYHGFSDAVWNGFSLRLPFELRLAEPSSVRTVDYASFYWPPWNPWGIAQLYRTERCILPTSSAVHLWETKVWKTLLHALSPSSLSDLARGTCFGRLGQAIHDSTFDFSAARLQNGNPSHEDVKRTYSASLLDIWGSAPIQTVPAGGAPGGGGCGDDDAQCATWALNGECTKNAAFMHEKCRKACGLCGGGGAPVAS